MAGKITTNSVVLGDSVTDTQNFVLKTNADGTATLARGALGGLGTVFGVNGSGALTGATLVAPALGTPVSGDLSNCTGYAVAGSGLTSRTAVATTSGTFVDFTGIPSWVKRITVMFRGVSTSGTSNPIIQLGDSGGIEATGYLGAASNMATGVATQNFTTGFGVFGTAGWIAARVVYGGLTISKIDGNTWVASGTWAASDDNQAGVTSGAKTLSDTLTQVRITTVNGTDTFDAGSVNILYE